MWISLRHKDQLQDDFSPLLPGHAFISLPPVMKVPHNLGCFQHEERCPKCDTPSSLHSTTRVNKLKNGDGMVYSEGSLSCSSRKFKAHLHFVDNRIRRDMKDRIIFVFIVNAVLNPSSTQSVVNETGCKPKTAEKSMKNAKSPFPGE